MTHVQLVTINQQEKLRNKLNANFETYQVQKYDINKKVQIHNCEFSTNRYRKHMQHSRFKQNKDKNKFSNTTSILKQTSSKSITNKTNINIQL